MTVPPAFLGLCAAAVAACPRSLCVCGCAPCFVVGGACGHAVLMDQPLCDWLCSMCVTPLLSLTHQREQILSDPGSWILPASGPLPRGAVWDGASLTHRGRYAAPHRFAAFCFSALLLCSA